MAAEPKGWTDYEPDTLQNMLDGCLFFCAEPAMEDTGANPGRIQALHNAHWSVAKIADDMRISENTVRNYLKKMEAKKQDDKTDTER